MNLTGDAIGARSERVGLAGPGRRDPTRILLACMPKSGSTFLFQLICAMPDFTRGRFVPPPMGRRDPDLDEVCLQQLKPHNCAAQLHMRNTERTTELYRKYGLKPVVLVRSLPDVVVSLRDHIRRESHVLSMLYAESGHAAFDDATLEAMIVRLAAPWYVNFYMSWRSAPDALLLSYEQLIADPAGVLRDVLTFAGAEFDDDAIAAAIASVGRQKEETHSTSGSPVAARTCRLNFSAS